jgi:two-component system sensor histidine kinase EvgS
VPLWDFWNCCKTQRQTSAPEDKTSVDHAAMASRSLLKLIGEILDLEKIESGLQEVMPKWVHVDAMIKEKVLLFTALAAQKGIGLRYDSHLDQKKLCS